MAGPVLFDANTLQNFAVVHRLDLLEAEYGHRTPHWTAVVRQEIQDGYHLAGVVHLKAVIDASWLGPPLRPATKSEQVAVAELHVGLNDGRRPPVAHAGEAESIFFALKLSATFVTDDRGAADFARRRGVPRVMDTVDVLRELQVSGTLTCPEAWALAQAMMVGGRTLRRNLTKATVCAT